MSCIRSLAAVSFLASIGFSTTVIAQEMISDTTARKQPLTAWGVQFEEFEYRYSDDDEELGVWDADAFYGTDEFKVRLLTTGEYEIEEQPTKHWKTSWSARSPSPSSSTPKRVFASTP